MKSTGNYFFDKLGKAISVEVDYACVSFECDKSVKTYLMLTRNAFFVLEMKKCLIHSVMMRLVGIKVDEYPKFLAKAPPESSHSIYSQMNSSRMH